MVALNVFIAQTLDKQMVTTYTPLHKIFHNVALQKGHFFMSTTTHVIEDHQCCPYQKRLCKGKIQQNSQNDFYKNTLIEQSGALNAFVGQNEV